MEIWKFTLLPHADTVLMPENARVLSAAFQGSNLCLWAIVTPSNEPRKRAIAVVGTGWKDHEKAMAGAFVDTVHSPDGLVFHVFDHGEER